MRRPLGVLGLALLILSGCAEFGDWRSKTAGSSPLEQTSSDAEDGQANVDYLADEAAIKALPPLPKRKPEVDSRIVAVLANLSQADGAPVSNTDPDSLVGLDFVKTKEMLGDPALLIEEPPAKIWSYNGEACILQIFFYPKVGGEDFRVLTYKVQGGEDVAEDEQAAFEERCLGDLISDARVAEN